MKTRKYKKYGLAGVILTVIMLLSVALIKNYTKVFSRNSNRIVMKSSERNYNKNSAKGVNSESIKVVVPEKDDKSSV